MKPIRPFGLGIMFFARFVSKKIMGIKPILFQHYIGPVQLKVKLQQAFFFRLVKFSLKLQPNLAPPPIPPKSKILATSLKLSQSHFV